MLAQCRDKGIDAAFAEIEVAQNPEVSFAADLDRLCNKVIATLRTGNTEQRDALVTSIEQMLKNDLPMEGLQDFLALLLAWLHEQDTQLLAEKLQPPFREAYPQMVAAVEQEEAQDTDEEDGITIEQLPDIISSVILRGTTEERQQFATVFVEQQQQLPPEDAPLGHFLECLAATLREETPEVASLEPPFTELWQKFQDALSVPPSDQANEEKDNDS